MNQECVRNSKMKRRCLIPLFSILAKYTWDPSASLLLLFHVLFIFKAVIAQSVNHCSALLQLPLLRGKERTFTLLHALVEQILSHQPELATFPQELTEFEAVPDGERRQRGI